MKNFESKDLNKPTVKESSDRENPKASWLRLIRKFGRYREQVVGRRKLYGMTDRELQDIGISRLDIEWAVRHRLQTPDSAKPSLQKVLAGKFSACMDFAELKLTDTLRLNGAGLNHKDLDALFLGRQSRLANDNPDRKGSPRKLKAG